MGDRTKKLCERSFCARQIRTRQDQQPANNRWRERAANIWFALRTAKRLQVARGNGGGRTVQSCPICAEIGRFTRGKIFGVAACLSHGISTRSCADHSFARVSPARI